MFLQLDGLFRNVIISIFVNILQNLQWIFVLLTCVLHGQREVGERWRRVCFCNSMNSKITDDGLSETHFQDSSKEHLIWSSQKQTREQLAANGWFYQVLHKNTPNVKAIIIDDCLFICFTVIYDIPAHPQFSRSYNQYEMDENHIVYLLTWSLDTCLRTLAQGSYSIGNTWLSVFHNQPLTKSSQFLRRISRI